MDNLTQRAPVNVGPETRLGFLIYRAGLAVSRGYERALSPLGATPVEAGVLSVLAYNGASHVRALGRTLGIGRQTIVNVAKALDDAGLIERDSSSSDARLSLLSITKLGRKRLAAIERISTTFDQQLREIVGPHHEQLMVEQLNQILNSPMFELERGTT